MGYHFIARRISLCLICMTTLQVSSTFLSFHTAYAVATKVMAFQIRRPDPNNPKNTNHVKVLSIQLSYLDSPQVGTTTPIQKQSCLKTPGQIFYTFTSHKSFEFGSVVYLYLYADSNCSGKNVTNDVYPSASATIDGYFDGTVPGKGQVKLSTCWVDLNVFPVGNGGGCNDGIPHP